MNMWANYFVERTGTSRSGYLQFVRQWGLVPPFTHVVSVAKENRYETTHNDCPAGFRHGFA
jgi:hypothetical protein